MFQFYLFLLCYLYFSVKISFVITHIALFVEVLLVVENAMDFFKCCFSRHT